MKNWRKYSNYHMRKNDDGSATYFVTVNNQDVEVSEEVYRVYASSARKMRYMAFDLKRDRVLRDAKGMTVIDEHGQPVTLPEREVSLEKLLEEDWDFPDPESAADDIVLRKMRFEELHRCSASLSRDESALIQALYFRDMTEREYSKELNISKTALHARKTRALLKMRNLLGDR